MPRCPRPVSYRYRIPPQQDPAPLPAPSGSPRLLPEPARLSPQADAANSARNPSSPAATLDTSMSPTGSCWCRARGARPRLLAIEPGKPLQAFQVVAQRVPAGSIQLVNVASPLDPSLDQPGPQ